MSVPEPYLYPSYFKLHGRWQYSAHPWASPYGRCEQRSNSFLTNLSSFTPVTYLSKLLGILCVAAFLQLELFRV
ncbi:hypothetical protein EDF82_3904 [Raoultella sp. BIGb0399]|nr:hypothetical protein EDF82_3904 [Raoultella sp. BIGb0399]